MRIYYMNNIKSVVLSILIIPLQLFGETSVCYGTTANGRLDGAVQLPLKGANFKAYHSAAILAGRTYVHSQVRSIVEFAYKSLEQTHPSKVYKYAETGLKEGGLFKPHKTHKNGLSVDFMTPVVNADGQSVHLPTTVFNQFGYDIEFNAQSEYDGLHIDYEALAAHIVALHQQAIAQGVDLWRVIFAPELQFNLYDTQYAEYLRTHIQFSDKRSWVRHDEHYHVDFNIPCEKM